MKARGVLATLAVPLALLAVLLAGCGGDSESSATDPGGSDTPSATGTDTPTATESPSEPDDGGMTTGPADPPDWPACETIWVSGLTIPVRYRGCLEGNNAVASDNLACSSGQRIVRYQDRFFGVAGGKVYETSGPLEKDKRYLKMVRVCRA